MIIGIDIRVLGNKTKSGIEEYTENLLSHMLPLDKKIKFKLFFSSYNSKLPDYDWLHLPNVELKEIKIPNRLLFLSSNLFGVPKLDELIGGVDVFFSPHFLLNALSSSCKRVVTFHDLSYIHFPEFFSWKRNLWHRIQMKPFWQSKFSDKIIAVSDSTRDDLIDIYDVDPAKIKVIYSGISKDLARLPNKILEEFRIKNKLPNKFILFLGKLEPRKNILSLIKAFNILQQRSEFNDLHLIIGGSRGWLDKDIFEEATNTAGHRKIIFKGQISDEQRKFYYGLASVFVYPSFFEGFGFPPLEAMACETPVITSYNSSLPEVTKGSSILVDPHNIQDISSSIASILKDESLRTEIINKGLKAVDSFDWSKTAVETLSCLIK